MDIFDDVKTNKCSNRGDVVSQRRIGKFSVSHKYIDETDPMLLALFSRVFITHAESIYHTHSICYIGYSSLFEPVPEGSVPFEYTVIVNIKTVPKHIPDIQASRYVEEKCMFLNNEKEDEIFYARPATINNNYDRPFLESDCIEKQYVVFSIKRMVPSDCPPLIIANVTNNILDSATKISDLPD